MVHDKCVRFQRFLGGPGWATGDALVASRVQAGQREREQGSPSSAGVPVEGRNAHLQLSAGLSFRSSLSPSSPSPFLLSPLQLVSPCRPHSEHQMSATPSSTTRSVSSFEASFAGRRSNGAR